MPSCINYGRRKKQRRKTLFYLHALDLDGGSTNRPWPCTRVTPIDRKMANSINPRRWRRFSCIFVSFNWISWTHSDGRRNEKMAVVRVSLLVVSHWRKTWQSESGTCANITPNRKTDALTHAGSVYQFTIPILCWTSFLHVLRTVKIIPLNELGNLMYWLASVNVDCFCFFAKNFSLCRITRSDSSHSWQLTEQLQLLRRDD